MFKERLFVHLSRFCEIRYCIVRHVGFLIGQGRPAGDTEAAPETVEQVIEMLRRPLPEGPALASILERLEQVSLDGRLPEPRTQCETDLFDALTIMFLSPRAAARARAAVRAAVGDATFEVLVAYLAFIRTAHYWTEMHPELTSKPDMDEILPDTASSRPCCSTRPKPSSSKGVCGFARPSIVSTAPRWRCRRANHGAPFISGLATP